MKIKQSGFLWKWYGFTPFHMWGVFLTGGLISGLGALFLFLAIGMLFKDNMTAIDQAEARKLYILIYISIASTLGAMAVWLCSAVMLLFFLGAHKLCLLEDDKEGKN